MTASLRQLWRSRAPRERAILRALVWLLGIALTLWLVQSAERARAPLLANVAELRMQSAQLTQQAIEIQQLRATPAPTPATTDLRALLQSRLDQAGLSASLLRIDAAGTDSVTVEFGAVAFADWLAWIDGLQSQQVQLAACRIQSLSTPGLASVSATLVRATPP